MVGTERIAIKALIFLKISHHKKAVIEEIGEGLSDARMRFHSGDAGRLNFIGFGCSINSQGPYVDTLGWHFSLVIVFDDLISKSYVIKTVLVAWR